MDRSEVITLLATTKAQNEYGVWVETPTRRDVFCQVDSVTRAEFFEGGRNGRTLPEIGSAINSAFPGQRIRELGYTRMSKLLADVPDVGLSTREDGTVVAVPEE